MALTNAEKQARWRDRRNELASAFDGTPKEVAEAIFRELGADRARKVVRALDQRLSNLKPGCRHCQGTGFMTEKLQLSTECGLPMLQLHLPCDCGPITEAYVKDLDNEA